MIVPKFGPEHGSWFVDFTPRFEAEAKDLLGSYERSAEALEGLFWVLGHGPLEYGTEVPGSDVKVAFLELDEGQFSVFFHVGEQSVNLLSVLKVESEDLG